VNAIFEELKTHNLTGEKFLALEKFQNLKLMGLSLRTDFLGFNCMEKVVDAARRFILSKNGVGK